MPMQDMKPGTHVWFWPKRGWKAYTAEIVADELVKLGAVGVIPQASLDAPRWLAENGKAFTDRGLQLVVGLGLDGGHPEDRLVHAIVAALDVPGAIGTMLNWESWWEGKAALADRVVDRVLALRPDAAQRCTDCPWWAPLFFMRGERQSSTHPRAPTKAFGRLCQKRFVQAYGAPQDDRSSRMLAWARDPSQYASLGSWEILPALQAYKRSVQDHVETLLQERFVCLWDYPEIDAEGRRGMLVVKAIRARGFDGPTAIVDVQRSLGLTADGILGPKTLGALGFA